MMDDSCAVCAEALEWVAYGPCGHREVCATCVARLRFVCSDRRCCLCQSHSRAVFVTKALGDFTRLINDFSAFPEDAKEGRVGSFWYHQHTQAYFDDLQQFRKIKSMCKLSCSICDKFDCGANDKPLPKNKKNINKFQNIGQLRAHITDRHGLFMCSLCLEGRKVFICEQRLYNRAQLEQHIERGDTEVDGDESDRCGFSGHPLCDFCLRNFYGDSELYTHMSRDHYTCHICQRQRPGVYDYYRDYDELENHFRHVHYLCEESSCLLKKFIVFASEAEMKRHYALEHGENMSRSERKVALQINTCFQHRRRNEGSHSGTRPLICSADAESMQYVSHSNAHADTATGASRSSASVHPSGSTFVDPEIFSEPSQTSHQIIEESSFPPLPSSSNRRRRKSKSTITQTATTGPTMASRLRRRYDGSLTVVNATPARPMSHHQSSSSSSSFNSSRSINQLNSGSSPPLEYAPSSQRSLSACLNKLSKSNPSTSSSCGKLTTDRGWSTSSHVSSLQHLGNIIEDDPSSDVPDPVGSGCCSSSRSVVGSGEERNQGRPVQKVQEDAQAANKLLIEKIRAELGFDKDKYAAFKLISKEYREGLINVREYLAYVQQFGLGNHVLDLARLCPDPQKGEELLRAHNHNFGLNNANSKKTSDVAGGEGDMLGSNAKGSSKKGKGKCVEVGRSSSSSESTPRENIVSCGKNGNDLEATQKFQKNDQYEVNGSGRRSRKGKDKCVDNGTLISNARTSTTCSLKEKRSSGKLAMVAPSINGKSEGGGIKPLGLGGDNGGEEVRGSNQGGGSGDGVLIIAERAVEKKGGKEKPTRTPKFPRARLGEESSTSSSEIPNIVPDQPPAVPKIKANLDGRMTPTGGGVWNNGGGRKLVVAMARSKPSRF